MGIIDQLCSSVIFIPVGYECSSALLELFSVSDRFFSLPENTKSCYFPLGNTGGYMKGAVRQGTKETLWFTTGYPDIDPNGRGETSDSMCRALIRTAATVSAYTEPVLEELANEFGAEVPVYRDSSAVFVTGYSPGKSVDGNLCYERHGDYLFTLVSSGIPGLQVCIGGKWGNVTPTIGGLYLLAGKQLEVLTGGSIRAHMYRVKTDMRYMRRTAAGFNVYVDENTPTWKGQQPTLWATHTGQLIRMDTYA